MKMTERDTDRPGRRTVMQLGQRVTNNAERCSVLKGYTGDDSTFPRYGVGGRAFFSRVKEDFGKPAISIASEMRGVAHTFMGEGYEFCISALGEAVAGHARPS